MYRRDEELQPTYIRHPSSGTRKPHASEGNSLNIGVIFFSRAHNTSMAGKWNTLQVLARIAKVLVSGSS